jgi:hypothetical protein
MEESLVLASIKYGIPIRDMILGKNQKVRVGGKNSTETTSCTAQWMKKLIPAEHLHKLENCSHSCAGKMGSLIFNEDELDAIQSHNAQDIRLWKKFVVPRYNEMKRSILEEYSATQEDLDKVVALYRNVVKRESGRH